MTTNSEKTSCNLNSETFIFSCSGGSDVGELADRTARALTRDGKGRMFCLAGIGGHLEGITEKTRSATRILVIDGCPQNCASKTLFQADIKPTSLVTLSDLGFVKGKSPLSQENLEIAYSAAVSQMQSSAS